MILNVPKVEDCVWPQSLGTAFGEGLDDLGLWLEEPQQQGHPLPCPPYPPQHVSLVGVAEDEDEIVDGIGLQLHRSHLWHKLVDNVVQQGVGYPVTGEAEEGL